MWKFNEATGKWEWIAEENKQQEIYNKVLSSLSPGLAPFEAIELTQEKKQWELENPGLKYEDFFGDVRGQQVARSSIAPQQIRGEQAEKLEEFAKKSQTTPSIYADVDDLFGENQSTADKWANGTLKWAGKTLTATAGGLAMIPGLLYGAATGSFSNVYDNDFQRMLDRANEAMDEALPNYVKKEVEDYSILQKMGTANFWANDVLSGMSFVTGAVLTEYLSLGIASSAIPGMASRFLRTGLKAGSKVDDASKAFRTLGMTAKETADVAGAVRRLGTGTFYESSVEARHFANEARENYIQDFIEQNGREPSEVELSEAMSKIYNVANGVFGLNTALVGLSNLVVLPKTFGPKILPKLASRITGNTADDVGKGLISVNKLSPTQLKFAAKKLKVSVDEVKAMGAIERSSIRTTTENILRKTYGVLKRPVTEGIFEEMLQGSINKAGLDYVAKYLDTESNFELAEIGISFMKGLEETYGSQEGWEEGVIGMIIGGIGLPGKSSTGKGIAMQGGVWDALRDPLKTQRLEYIEKAKNMSSPERIKALIEYAASVKKAANKYNDALELGDILSAKSAEHESFFSLVNFKMKLNDYQSIEDEINQITSEYADDQFASLFGYENVNENEIAKRKNELKESLLKRARNTKNNILKAQRMVGKDNVYLRDALAYNFSSVENLDAREQDLAERISNILGTTDARSLREIIALNNKIKFKTEWLKTYEEKLKTLEEAKAKLISLQTDVDVEQEKIDKQSELVKEYSQEIAQLQEEEFKARKNSVEDVPTYLRDFEAFSAAIKNIVDLRSKVQDYYFDSLDQKTELKKLLQDLQTLAYHRETFIGEINRLFSKEGQEEFNKTIAELQKENRKVALKDQEFWSQALIQQAVAPFKEGVTVKNVQELFLQNLGIRLQNAGFTINNQDEAAEEVFKNTPNSPDTGISLEPEIEKEFTTNTFKQWLIAFNSGVPEKYKENDSIQTKIDKVSDIIKYYKSKLNEIDLKIEEFKDTPVGEDFKKFKELEGSNSIQSKIEEFSLIKEKLEEIINFVPSSGPVLYSPFDLFKLNTSFLSDEEKQLIAEQPQNELYKNSFLEFVDYTPITPSIPSTNNSNVQISLGLVNHKNKALALKTIINDKEVIVGHLLDPQRFIVNGQQISFNDIAHLQEINPNFVSENEITDLGKQFISYANSLTEIINSVSENEKIFVEDNFTLNKNLNFNVLKGEDKPTIENLLSLPECNIKFSYKTIEKGVSVEVTEQKPVIVGRRKNTNYFYVLEDTGWRLLDAQKEGNKILSLEEHFKKASNNKPLTGQFFLLASYGFENREKLFSISSPKLEEVIIPTQDAGFIVENYAKILAEQIEKVEEQKATNSTTPVKGVTLTDNEDSPIFISLLNSKDLDSDYSPTAFLTADMFGEATLVIEAPGKDNFYVNLKLTVKNGKLYSKLKNKEINSSEQLINIINSQLKYELNRKKDKREEAGLPITLKVGNIFKRLDRINPESVTGEVKDMSLFRSNVNVKITYVLKPRNIKNPASSAPSSKGVKPANSQEATIIETFRKGIKEIENLTQEEFNEIKDNLDAEIEAYKNELKSQKISSANENALLIMLDQAVNILKKKYSDTAQDSNKDFKKDPDKTSEEGKDIDDLLQNKFGTSDPNNLQNEYNNLLSKINLSQASEEEMKRFLELQNILNNNQKASDEEAPPFSISQTASDNPILLDVALKNLARMLNMKTPENPNGIYSMQDISNIMNNIQNNGITWGAYLNKVIYLSKEASKGTEYHEAFHAVFRSLLSPKQISSYYYAAEKEYGTPTIQNLLDLKKTSSAFTNLSMNELKRLWLEEKMAEAFKDYAVKKDEEKTKEKPKGILRVLFDKIKKLIGLVKKNKNDLDILFEDIYSGKFKNSVPTNKLYNFSKPAFALIRKPSSFNSVVGTSQQGYLNNVQSQRIINYIASKAIEKNNTDGTLSQEDIFDIINEVAFTKYNIQTYKEELAQIYKVSPDRASAISGKIDEIQRALLSVQSNREGIVKEVLKRISIYNITSEEEMTLEEYIENETPERAFDTSIAEIGGFSSLTKAMKQFISFTPEYVDEFGFSEFTSVDSEKFKSVSNPFVIYTGVERVLAGVSPLQMLNRLSIFAETNPSAKAFYNHLISEINKEIAAKGFINFDAAQESSNIEILKNSSVFTTFSQTFNKDKVSFVVAVYDYKKGIVKSFKSNVIDDGKVQLDEWFKSFEAKNRKNKGAENQQVIEQIKNLFVDVENILPNNLENTISSIKNLFDSIGINVSKGLIKHSILQHHYNLIYANSVEEGSVNAPYFQDLIKTFEAFNEVNGIFIDDLLAMNEPSIMNNPFSEKDKDSAIGRLKRIAQSNSVFDESVASSTFENSEGKTIFSYIQPSYYNREIAKWNKRKNSASNLFKAIRDNVSDEEGAEIIMQMMKDEGTPYPYYFAKNMYQTIKFNPYLNAISNKKVPVNELENFKELFTNIILKNLNSFIIDGARLASLEEKEGQDGSFITENTYKDSTGVSYGNMSGQSKLLQPLLFFAEQTGNALRKSEKINPLKGDRSAIAKQDKNNILEFAPFIITVNEAKKTQNATLAPVQTTTDELSYNANDLTVEYILNTFKQEFYRIQQVVKEIKYITENNQLDDNNQEVFDLKNYHYKLDNKGNKDYTKGRGLDLFQFKDNIKDLNDNLYQKVISLARSNPSPEAFKEVEDELKIFIKDSLTPFLFERYVNTLASNVNNFISEQEDKTLKSTAKEETETSTEEPKSSSTEVPFKKPLSQRRFKNNLLPSFYSGKDNLVDLNALAEFFYNDLINSIAVSNLVHGDFSMLYKDYTDVIKRNARFIAAGTPLGNSVTKIAVVKSIPASKRNEFGEEGITSDIEKLEEQDTTDAQNKCTLDWYIGKYLIPLGKFPLAVEEIYRKIERGYELSKNEVDVLNKFQALANPRKIVIGERYVYDKMSMKTLLRSETSYIYPEERELLDSLYDKLEIAKINQNEKEILELYEQIHSLWKPIPSNAVNHYILNKLESTRTDVLAYDSAFKSASPNVGEITGNVVDGFNIDLRPFIVADENIKEQVKTDNIKSEIVDPTQLLNTIFSEQDDSLSVNILGAKSNIKVAKEAFFTLVSKRTRMGFEEMRKSIFDGNIPKYKYLLKMFKQNLMLTGADPYLIEMVSEAEGDPNSSKYNLNMPNTIDKIESMFLAYVQKNTLKFKASGTKATLTSDFGYGLMEYFNPKTKKIEIISFKEFRKNPKKYEGKITSRRLEFGKKDSNGNFYSEILISPQIAKEYGFKIGQELPPELLAMYGVRIPTQDKHSMGYFKVVGFLPGETGNQIVMPYEILKLSGADFDIDSEYLRTLDFFTYNNEIIWFGKYLKEKTIEDALLIAREEYIKEKSSLYEVKEKKQEFLNANTEYKETLKQISELRANLKNIIKLNNLSTEIFYDTFDEIEIDNEIDPVVSDLSTIDKFLITVNLISDIEKIKEENKKLVKKTKRLERDALLDSLSYLGYKVSEEEFSKEFKTTIENNREALSKGLFNKINPLTIAEINNTLIPIIGVLIMNESNQEVTKTITSTDSFNKIEEELEELGIEDNTKLDGIHDAVSKHKAAVSNDVGSENIGPAAVFNLMFQRLHLAGLKFNSNYLAVNKPTANLFTKSFELIVNNGIIFNSSGERINSLIDQIIAAMTDNAKDPKAAKNNLSYSLLGAALLRIGLGESFNTTILMQRQPIMVDFSDILSYNRSGLVDNVAYKSEILKDLLNDYSKNIVDKKVSIQITDDNLKQALLYKQDPSTSKLSADQFNALQVAVISEMIPSIEVGDFLRNFSSLIALSRGLKPSFSENYDVYQALENLGIQVVLGKNLDPSKIDSYSLEHVKNYTAEDYPFDLLPLIKEDKILSNYIKTFNIIMNDSGKFFILETPFAKEVLSIVENNYRENTFNYQNRRKELRKNLLSFFSMHAYRVEAGIKEGDLDFSLNTLFESNEEEPIYIQQYRSLLTKPEFNDNKFLKALTIEPYNFSVNNKTGLANKTLYKLAFNSRTKNNPDYVERLIDDFKSLALSSDPEAKAFAANAFLYLMKKDAGAFKADTFIRQIAPIFLTRISKGLDKIQLVLNNEKGNFSSVVGMSKEEFTHQFVELFMRYEPNSFKMKSVYADKFFGANKKSETIKKIKENYEESETLSEEELNKYIAENYYPIYSDRTDNNNTIVIDLTKGLSKEQLKQKPFTPETKKIMGINKSIILSTKIFKVSPNGQITYPPFFKILTRTEDGRFIPTYYKLKIVGKGKYIQIANNVVIADNKFTFDADSSNLYSSKDINGMHAIYEKTTPILSKEISPWAYTLNEINVFDAYNKLSTSETVEAPKTSEQTTNSSTLKSILAKKVDKSIFSSPVEPTTPVETKEEESPFKEEKEFNPSNLPKFNINKINQIKFNNPFTPTDDSESQDSKSSASREINQTVLTNTLNKLSNKFGIKWVYDTSIPGLGQFKNGVVLINPNKAKADTPFHEFAHPFIAIVKVQNPALYNNLKNQLINSEIGQKTLAKVQRLYPELSTESQIEEAIVDVIGQYAANQDEIKKEKGLWNAIKTFLRRVSEYLKDLLSNSNKKVIPSELDPNTTLEEIASILVIDNPIDLGIENEINYNLKVLNALVELAVPKNKKYTTPIPERMTIKVNSPKKPNIETNLRKILRGKGVSDNQIDLMFDFMKANNIEEISVGELITAMTSAYSYTIEINIAKEKLSDADYYDRLESGDIKGHSIDNFGGKWNVFDQQNKLVAQFDTESEAKQEQARLNNLISKPTQHYSNFSAPGGTKGKSKYEGNPDWEYHELEFKTPLITPSIKGHAEFATDNGIGWIRVWYNKKTGVVEIQEVQSDLFQKGRDKESLISSTKNTLQDEFSVSQEPDGSWSVLRNNPFEVIKSKLNSKEEAKKEVLNITNKDKENQFLQLLNKDNNWVTFFVKSIIQDSAKKGYEKVLFPTGNTASKVQRHSTLEEFKKQKEDKIKELERSKEFSILEENGKYEVLRPSSGATDSVFNTKKEAQEFWDNKYGQSINTKINQLKQELKRVETEGFGALMPIWNFYENTVTDILKKQGYNPTLITDEYGNTWNEIEIKADDLNPILLQKEDTIKPGVSELFDSNPELANEVYEALGFKESPNINNVTFDEILEEVSFEEIINKDKEELYNSNRSQIYLDLINKISPNTKFKIVKNLKVENKSVNGVYTFKGDIFISRDTYQWLNEGKTLTRIDLKTILHEVIHKEIGNRFEQEKLANSSLYKEFIPIFSAAQKLQGQGYYGMTNPNEFLSEAITNIEFQDALRRLPSVKTKGNINLFNDIIEFIKKLININTIENTLLEDVFKISERLIKESRFINNSIEQQAQQLYSQYLDTIFPDSKVKDIVYHGNNQKINQFEVRKEPLIHFGSKNAALQRGNVLNQVLLNVKDLQTIKDGMWFLGTDEGGLLKELLDRNILTIEQVKSINEAKNKAIQQSPYFNENYRMALPEGEKAGNKKLQEILKDKNIGFEYVNFSEDKGSTSYAVPSQEQIHILGSKQDIEGFKEFVNQASLNNQTVPGDAATLFNNFVNTSTDDVIEAIDNCN